MQSMTTPRSATQDRDVITLIAAWWRSARALAWIGQDRDRLEPWRRAASRADAEAPWYDDPSASRGL